MKKIYFKDIANCLLEPTDCYIKEFNPSFYMGMHNHSYFEFMYANKGNFTVEILPNSNVVTEDSTDELSKTTQNVVVHQGEIIFIDAYLFHRLRITEKQVIIYNVELNPRFREDYNPCQVNSVMPIYFENIISQTKLKILAENTKGYFILPASPKMAITFKNFITALINHENSIEDNCSLQCHMLMFFMEISKCVISFTQNNISYIRKILIYIKHNLNQKITLDDIAAAVGYHKAYISFQFKKYTGKSIMKTINNMRIDQSLQLLFESNLSISQIAQQTGFSTYEQMVYEFKKTIGMSPSDCRKSFLSDEMTHPTHKDLSFSIRIDEDDFLLDDEAFRHKYYKANIQSKTQELLKQTH